MTPEEREALAGELALGVLAGDERAAALRLKLADPAFAADVRAWEGRLAPLGESFADAPGADVWTGIERRLGTANDNGEQRLRVWRWSAIGSGALAASLAAILVLRPLPAPVEIVRAPDHIAMAQLSGGEGERGVLLAATYDPHGGDLKIRAMQMPSSDLAPELWIIPSDGVPRSLGLVAPNGMSRMKVPMGHRKMMLDGATLAITMEPRDGAPHKAPSSAPIAAGKISTI